MSSEYESWRFAVDRGGTFTDVIGWDPQGRVHTSKLLSHAPGRYDDAIVEGVARTLRAAGEESATVEHVRVGTTVATNALLERRGEPTALVVTEGFADALEIGYQDRPDIFALRIERPDALYDAVVEVPERLGADGEIVRPLDESQLRGDLEELFERGWRAAAILFVHGFRFPDHEQRAARIAREVGFTQVSVSSEVSPLRKLVLRGATTVADAYLAPGLGRYVDRLGAHLPEVRLSFMQSSGGLVDANRFSANDSLLSGPVGGVVGMAHVAREIGRDRVVGFDMGGTSTDVSIFDGGYERVDELEIGGVRLRVPALAIHTVAAGGGSLARLEDDRLRVGPDSAGADPGPASYRRGGGLTVTDANLFLGRLQPDLFPAVFGADEDEPLDVAAAKACVDTLAQQAESAGISRAHEELAAGILEIATARMAGAIERITIGRGLDVTKFALCTFGGAGGQHACAVAAALGMEAIVVPPMAGVLSALGIGLSERRARREGAVEERLTQSLFDELDLRFGEIEVAATRALIEEEESQRPAIERSLRLRYEGGDTTLSVPDGTLEEVIERFSASHRRLFGFIDDARSIVLESLVVEAISPATERAAIAVPEPIERPGGPVELVERPVWFSGGWQSTRFVDRASLRPRDVLAGPVVLVEANATTVVEPGWEAAVDERLNLVLEHSGGATVKGVSVADPEQVDPVLLEVFNHRFMEIAEQMGVVLEKTARSVNIKERLDFSCALFDGEGQLVANAPHMPVHLGSMGESVRAIRERVASISPGDVFAINDPYAGGTHLPDITVVTPLFLGRETTPQFWVASRGHHADVGGTRPGSMPPDSRSLDEEGVVLRDLKIVADGEFLEAEVRSVLTSGPWPARSVEQNLADLKAQIAANERGLFGLQLAVEQFGRAMVVGYMQHVQTNAAESVRRAIRELSSGSYAVDLDNGQRVAVAVSIDREAGSARVDFTGSSEQRENNFNAPESVCRAAVLYVFRTLVDRDIPLNAGCLEPLEIVVEPGSMLCPSPPGAVVAGNVETSQCITDALFGALSVLAGSQGTMNNLTFGDDEVQYYETICGGAGAGRGFDGASGVHTHMTNSRLTDPEVLERRFPVRVEGFSLRRGSGGAGAYRGGDGVVRKLRFLAPLAVSILANRRLVPPHGLAGGAPGALGVSTLERAGHRAGDRDEVLDSAVTVSVEAGDLLTIETPGGGGCGEAG